MPADDQQTVQSALTPTTWQQLSPATAPSARMQLSMALDPVSNRVILFGGWDGTSHLADTWAYEGTTWRQLHPPVSPPARNGAVLGFDPTSNRLVLFGGFSGTDYLGDTWTFDGTTETWEQVAGTTAPAKRTTPAMFNDPQSGRLLVFGGLDLTNYIPYKNDLWRFANGAWRQVTSAHQPSARSYMFATLDQKHGQVLIYGGLADVNPVNTWSWDGNDWALRDSTYLGTRYGAGGGIDLGSGRPMLFGGANGGTAYNQTYEWANGSNAWQPFVVTTAPQAREGFGSATDPLTGDVLIFGGEDSDANHFFNDTWTLRR